jgi:hypothetical protein
MAFIERHPHLDDPFVEMSLRDIAARGGVADIFEEGRVILIQGYRLPFDFGALKALRKSTEEVEDPDLRRKLKKLTAPYFFDGQPPLERNGRLIFPDRTRQAIFDVLCSGDRDTFERAAGALKSAHDEVLRIFDTCFPGYQPFRLVPSVRLTRTLFENLHWDNHSIEDDFHQARIFVNLDTRPRLWNLSYSFTEWMRAFYREHDLGRFAGKDPNLLITWMDNQPRHRVAFEPGEVWLGESRLVSHQIVYGESAMVYMWFVNAGSMANPANRFNAQVEAVHRQMRKAAAA